MKQQEQQQEQEELEMRSENCNSETVLYESSSSSSSTNGVVVAAVDHTMMIQQQQQHMKPPCAMIHHTTSDPYVTADLYRQCAISANAGAVTTVATTVTQQQVHETSDTSYRRLQQQQQQQQYVVHYINDRPYVPQWRVEIVKDDDNDDNNNNDTINRSSQTDLYDPIKSVAAAILLLHQQQQQQQQQQSLLLNTTTSTITPTNELSYSTCQDIIPIIQKMTPRLNVERVMGGVTNTLYKVSGFQSCSTDVKSSMLHVVVDDDSTKNNGWQNNNSTSNTTGLSHSHKQQQEQQQQICCLPNVDNVLVRIFGAEGLIDRDDETCIFASLSVHGLAPMYYGRFANGRVEGYENGMRPLDYMELSSGPSSIARGIATNLAKLHYGFPILPTLSTERSQPTLWKQLYDWLYQAEQVVLPNTTQQSVVESLQIATKIRPELQWLQEEVETMIGNNDKTSDSNNGNYTHPIVFCHNDLLAANILYNDMTECIQLIDFEYGGINYRSFDIANHFNEYAGGPPTEIVPNYNLLPTHEQQRYFIRTYLEAATATIRSLSVTNGTNTNIPIENNATIQSTAAAVVATVDEFQVDAMMKEIEIFSLANHLYWGLWAINQAFNEGCLTYDYLTYGVNRIKQYWIQKQQSSS